MNVINSQDFFPFVMDLKNQRVHDILPRIVDMLNAEYTEA